MSKPDRTTLHDIDRASLNHIALKDLARSMGRPLASLYALSDWHDPFVADMPGRRAQAEWFAAIWRDLGLEVGVHHDRRIHYRLVSPKHEPFVGPDGNPYLNTERCFITLTVAIRDARYLGLIPPGAVIDRRNPEPTIFLAEEEDSDGFISTGTGLLSRSSLDIGEPKLWLPRLGFTGPTITQRHHIEVWCEKSTMNDVLMPLGGQYGVNIVTAIGEFSATRCEDLVARAAASGKPVRILYISDFDPAGFTMPVSAARKIEFFAKDGDHDIQVRPVVLTHDQCVGYRLPRTPIKKTERRAARFEERFGEGATELDALEAIHPGELHRIIQREILRYFDDTLDRRLSRVTRTVTADLDAINREVRERHAPEIAALEEECVAINAEVERMRERIAMMEDALAARADPVFDAIAADLEEQAPDADDYEWPEPVEADEDNDPLFDSTRGYLTQIERYREHQGKDAAPILQRLQKFNLVCVECGGAFSASRPTAKMCSTQCRTKEWRRRNPGFDQNAARKRRNARG